MNVVTLQATLKVGSGGVGLPSEVRVTWCVFHVCDVKTILVSVGSLHRLRKVSQCLLKLVPSSVIPVGCLLAFLARNIWTCYNKKCEDIAVGNIYMCLRKLMNRKRGIWARKQPLKNKFAQKWWWILSFPPVELHRLSTHRIPPDNH